MFTKNSYCVVLLLVKIINCTHNKHQSDYSKWTLNFPEGSLAGMFLAVALPLSLPRNNAYLAFNWEVNYPLPSQNHSLLTYPPVITERFSRHLVYDALEMKLESQGYPGRNCLLRVICEASAVHLDELNGVLGDLVNILLRPSTSKNMQLSNEYEIAELYGRHNKNCLKFNKTCSVSFLDLVSLLERVVY